MNLPRPMFITLVHIIVVVLHRRLSNANSCKESVVAPEETHLHYLEISGCHTLHITEGAVARPQGELGSCNRTPRICRTTADCWHRWGLSLSLELYWHHLFVTLRWLSASRTFSSSSSSLLFAHHVLSHWLSIQTHHVTPSSTHKREYSFGTK